MTCLIVFLTGLYIWSNNKEKIAALGYLPDGDWSKSSLILAEIRPTLFDMTIDQTGNLHLAYVEYNRQKMIGEMRYLLVDQTGKILQQSERIVSNKRLSQLTLEVFQDKLHIFWVGQGKGDRLDFYCTRLDLLGNQIETRTILEGELNSVQELVSAVSPAGKFFFAWIEEEEDSQEIKTFYLPDLLVVDSQPEVVSTNNCFQLNLTSDQKQGYHLAWIEESKTKDNQPNYYLYYQNYYPLLERKSEQVYIDQISPTAAGLTVDREKVYLTWNKALPIIVSPDDSAIEKLYPNYVIFGTVIDPTDPTKEINIKRLTEQRGPTINQNIVVDKAGQVHLVYYDTFDTEMGMTHQIYSPGFLEEDKISTRLYPDQQIYPKLDLFAGRDQTFFFKDSKSGVHLCWLDSYSLYYANTVQPEGLTPLQLVGVNRNHLGINLLMSLGYILFFPFTYLFLFMHIFSLAILTIVFAILLLNINQESKLYQLLKNPYWGTILICLIHQLVYQGLGLSQDLFWSLAPNSGQIWFAYLLSTIATLIFIGINRSKEGAFFAGMSAFYWIYWGNMINLIFHLPQINF